MSREKRYQFLCLILVIMVLLGCTQKQKESVPRSFSMLFNETKSTPLKDDWLVLAEYEKRKNVIFDIQVADDAYYENAINIALRTGTPPDIILKVWPQTISEFANDGFLLPVSDYYDQMPFFKAYIESHNLEKELQTLKNENGKYYLLPGFQRKIQVQQWIYRKDLFEKNNLDAPKTYDELFNSLVLLKEKYPFTTPISATWGGAHLLSMIGAGFGIPAGWGGNQLFDTQTNRWLFAPATENYKEMCIFLNRCYNAGILDPAFLTQNENDFYEKIQDGRVLVTVTWVTSGFYNWNEALKKNGFTNGEWVPLPVPESPMGVRALPSVDSFRKGLSLSVQVKDKLYFEELLQFIDWALYSEEGQTLTYWGIEGLTYQESEEGKTFLPFIATPKNPEGTINIKAEYGMNTFFNSVENDEFEDYKKPREIVTFLNESLKNNDATEPSPPFITGEETIKAINILSNSLNPYVSTTTNKFITGELDINNYWNRYLKKLTNYGYKTLESIWNSSQRKYAQ